MAKKTTAVVLTAVKKANGIAKYRRRILRTKETVGRNLARFIKYNPTVTLGDLLYFLDNVWKELHMRNDDDLLVDIIDDLEDARDYLEEFGPVNQDLGDGELATVEYRRENLYDDIVLVKELIEHLGEKYKATRLPKTDWRKKAA